MTDEFQPTMQMVAVKKSDLISKLIENRETHQAQYLEALAGYREMAIDQLAAKLKEIKKAVEVTDSVIVSVTAPESHTEDYDTAIQMLALSVHDEMYLSAQEFSQYVMDEWGWKQRFQMSSSTYMNYNK